MPSIERSGYYAWLKQKPSPRRKANEELDKKISVVFEAHKDRYGAVRMTAELREEGETCSKNRVARRMRQLGLQAKAKNLK